MAKKKHINDILNELSDKSLAQKLIAFHDVNQNLYQGFPASEAKPFNRVGGVENFTLELLNVVNDFYENIKSINDSFDSKDRLIVNAFLRSFSVLGIAHKKKRWDGITSEYYFDDIEPLSQVLYFVTENNIRLTKEMSKDLIEDTLVSVLVDAAIAVVGYEN